MIIESGERSAMEKTEYRLSGRLHWEGGAEA
jgi:hypothetical protein